MVITGRPFKRYFSVIREVIAPKIDDHALSSKLDADGEARHQCYLTQALDHSIPDLQIKYRPFGYTNQTVLEKGLCNCPLFADTQDGLLWNEFLHVYCLFRNAEVVKKKKRKSISVTELPINETPPHLLSSKLIKKMRN